MPRDSKSLRKHEWITAILAWERNTIPWLMTGPLCCISIDLFPEIPLAISPILGIFLNIFGAVMSEPMLLFQMLFFYLAAALIVPVFVWAFISVLGIDNSLKIPLMMIRGISKTIFYVFFTAMIAAEVLYWLNLAISN